MSSITRTFSRTMAMLLACALIAASAPVAEAKPLTPETVHARILKRGLGNWVGVDLQNGTEVVGRITNVDDQSFGLQLHNDPEVTTIFYGDVVGLYTGISRGGFWAITAAGIGGMIVVTVVGFNAVHN
ncbi:MAG: hypothetical protein WBQ94_08605, partial [Terracidiphilus sp.]